MLPRTPPAMNARQSRTRQSMCAQHSQIGKRRRRRHLILVPRRRSVSNPSENPMSRVAMPGPSSSNAAVKSKSRVSGSRLGPAPEASRSSSMTPHWRQRAMSSGFLGFDDGVPRTLRSCPHDPMNPGRSLLERRNAHMCIAPAPYPGQKLRAETGIGREIHVSIFD